MVWFKPTMFRSLLKQPQLTDAEQEKTHRGGDDIDQRGKYQVCAAKECSKRQSIHLS